MLHAVCGSSRFLQGRIHLQLLACCNKSKTDGLNHLLEKPQAFFAAVWGTLPKLIGNPNRGPLRPLKGAILRFPVNLG